MLEIKNLNAVIKDQQILKNFNLKIKKGEIHAIMGTNGSGKSTLSKVLVGHPNYSITHGEILFENTVINEKSPEERAELGLFLAFQYPVEISGVSNEEFLRIAFNLQRKRKNLEPLGPIEFLQNLKKNTNASKLGLEFLSRNVNEGFSGGEKKKNEILQMLILKPKLAILDEVDSGLDIDALKKLSTGIKNYMDNEKSLLLITHYQRLLDYIKPNFVHIMHKGQIIKTGDANLALEVEKKGYDWLINY
jgi:Fe-S cluster assembly ATP-binding protein